MLSNLLTAPFEPTCPERLSALLLAIIALQQPFHA